MKVYILLATNKISNHVYIPFVFLNKQETLDRRKEMLELNPVWKTIVIKEREVK